MSDLSDKTAEVLGNNQGITQGHAVDVKGDKVKDEHKLPEWVKCLKCGGKPVGYNWLKPVSPDPACKVFIHLDCIEKGLSRMFDGMGGRR